MLTKLLKYEFRASARIFGIVYLAILGLCLSAGVLTRAGEEGLSQIQNITLTLYLVTGLFLFAAVVITTVVNLRRFYTGVFKDEGYLLHTLPVPPWAIIASKLIPALVWTLATVAVMGLSLLLSAVIGFHSTVLQDLLEGLAQFSPAAWRDLLLCVVLGLTELLSTVLRIYAVIALGQTAYKHRIASAVLIWFGLNMVQSWLGMLVGESLFSHMVETLYIPPFEPRATPSFLLMIGISLFWCAVYWAVTQWVITKKLNLE